ncbi:hypothetical protein EC9_46190 [Rosistilla ulvae]|uniref:Uncharacterized protein n=1 Tax=Rosistilla ulvae TaxID=1930277 RepID=A0A517M6B0_9BACT|nr:hypothetical protein EC9_46190 [Rosistilla ulvae]
MPHFTLPAKQEGSKNKRLASFSGRAGRRKSSMRQTGRRMAAGMHPEHPSGQNLSPIPRNSPGKYNSVLENPEPQRRSWRLGN